MAREEIAIVKSKNLVPVLVALALLFALAAAAQHKPTQAELQKQATVTKEDATKTALARVPSGTVKEAELEKEHGKLVWSFDIATPGTKDITEVQVDAKTGAIVSQTKESAASEAKEKKADSNKKKSKQP